MTNAERQRMYRMRRDSDPEKRAKYVQQKRAKYNSDIDKGKRKRKANMSERELRQQRNQWRRRQRLCRANKSTAEQHSLDVTPADEFAGSSTMTSTPSVMRGCKRVQRNRTALYKENLCLREEVVKLRRLADKYRKRFSRVTKQQMASVTKSPGKMAKTMLKKQNRSEILRTLIFHNALLAQIKEKYAHATSNKRKYSIAASVSGHIVRKYRLGSLLRKNVGFTKRMATRATCYDSPAKRKTSSGTSSEIEYDKVQAFFEQDEVSRVCAGVKQIVTRHGIKKQKRLLNDTMNKLSNCTRNS